MHLRRNSLLAMMLLYRTCFKNYGVTKAVLSGYATDNPNSKLAYQYDQWEATGCLLGPKPRG